ncbi:Uncharacterized conserved protein, Ntn-hydrolase superfamily [Halopseudomonas xinjiangensis]|uniref:Uncharacterized conserved protein, Ntn-hydrolase superfamily n=1 Tax=Halopseudomonas xinjiangensis TaxID=487184 RepID=A0A1H1Z296_9GAMM|nr:DUF1028 domain-containing protein [Halopseudomonas xinjiangensis]SDT27306.1 Uncharacterized conserved protein, Ntn-hydrolase superfamily [Halopseudomonas xinjiangensis]
MTFSVVAHCARTGQIGVGASTAVQSVGKLACHGIPKVGVIASQALLNPYLAYDGLRLMQHGASASDALDQVIKLDAQRQDRQVGVVDMQGRTAVWTGCDTIPWAGHLQGDGFATQGNRLAGPHVLDSVVATMNCTVHLDLAERLVLAIQTGESEGGDVKGERSANIMVFSEEEYPLCDIRIDDHDDPMQELGRLYRLYIEEILPSMSNIPKRKDVPRPPGAEPGPLAMLKGRLP